MWARSVEVMFGVWLAISPFVFGHHGEIGGLVASDWVCAGVIVVLACASFAHRFRRAHFGILAVCGWLIGYGYLGFTYPIPPGAQNEMLVGLILVLFAIIPMRAEEPPESWREHLERQTVARAYGPSPSQPREE